MSSVHIHLSRVETQLPLRLALDRRMSDEELFEFCALNDNLCVERNAEGEVIVMAPAGGESSHRNVDIAAQLQTWSKKDGRGRAFDSNAGFFLPNGSMLSPDAAWIETARLQGLSKEAKRKFIYLCPDFVVELLSPSDRLSTTKKKMTEWVGNGAKLAWLVDADKQTIHVYRPNQDVEVLTNIQSIAGQGPVEGFILDLCDVFAEL